MSKPSSRPRLAAIMMQKDEGVLLKFWFEHSKWMFGAENLFILDNASADPLTLSVLSDIRSEGAKVVSCSDPDDYERREKIVTELIRLESSNYDWFFPLDSDEMVTVLNSDRTPLNNTPAALFEEIDRAERSGRTVLRVSRGWYNIPGTTKGYAAGTSGASDLGIRKVIVRSDFPGELDAGYHFFDWGKRKDIFDDQVMLPSNLAYVHFHNRTYQDLVRSAREKLKGRVSDFRDDTLRAYKGKGMHLATYLRQTEKEYMRSFALANIDLSPLFSHLSLPLPYSAPLPALTVEQVKLLSDPVNLFHIAKMGTATGEAELKLLRENLRGVRSYFEYGAGASTLLACEAGVQRVVSVETSIGHCERVLTRMGLSKYVQSSRLSLRHVEIGDTQEWGFARVEPSPAQIDEYLRQPGDNWPFELALIDGRYRVATAAAVYLAWAANGSAADFKLHFAGFYSRDDYRPIDDLFDIVDVAGQTAVLRPRPGHSDLARDLTARYGRDPV